MPLARPVVEFALDKGDLFVANGTEVRAFWKVIANEPVGVLVGTAFPRAVRVSEEALCTGRFFDRPPVAVLRPIVHGDGTADVLREICEPFLNCRTGRRSTFVFEFGDEHQSCLALHQCVDARRMVTGLHGVALPVSDAGSAVNDCGTHFNGSTLWLQHSLASACAVGHSPLAPPAQTGAQVFTAGSHPPVSFAVHLRVDELVDGFVGYCFSRLALDDAGNLLGRTPALQLSRDKHPDPLILEPLVPATALSLCQGAFVCLARSVQQFLGGAVAPELPGH